MAGKRPRKRSPVKKLESGSYYFVQRLDPEVGETPIDPVAKGLELIRVEEVNKRNSVFCHMLSDFHTGNGKMHIYDLMFFNFYPAGIIEVANAKLKQFEKLVAELVEMIKIVKRF